MVEARLATWRGRGAARWDAARFGFVEALARRTAACSGAARSVLDAKLAVALQAYSQHFVATEADASSLLTEATAHFPAAADSLRQCHAAGDPGALRRQVADLQSAARCGLLAGLGRKPGVDDAADGRASGLPVIAQHALAGPELKGATLFRKTWARLGVERRLRESLSQAPGHAGPLNSHGLVLRALQQMHQISPDYLSRFVDHVDALLWLERASTRPASAGGRSPASRALARDRR